jgi:FolB domain-containing protein
MASERRDRIHIRDLACRCVVGVNPEERVNKQDILVNVTLETDLARSGASDRIEDTVDYKDLKNRILSAVEDSQFFLIERLAECIAEVCLADKRVQAATVTIDKPGALRFARSVAIEIYRERPGHA